ncbi:DUF3617 domain-containing protein [Sulfurisoma sediminicola]|uniref:Uncharacterized protein DUF3617 n=1 Tax=Sulfurisoma sediminicola TaxID=1381557 RepID=A0A497XKE8_9PROT|nr:DUF3617 domain-containing protein [Sulfurisoma sediminicola]RLJ67855.1 uncharacterized protein DUF3617 [Sulfurisoma sediminicola]
MRKSTLVVLVTLSGTAFAQSSGLKPGLWEVNQIRQVMDGRDMTAQMAAAQEKMQQSMAKMTPERRKQMEAMMGGQAMPAKGAGGGTRICISPAMAARDKPMVDPEGRCEPAKVSRSGNKTSFEFNCTANGRTMVGKGESTVSSDMVTSRMDMTTTDANGRHTMQSESQMKYLGSDCQGVKPMDQLAKGAQGPAR